MEKIEILYEDGNILALNKPAGLVVHYDGKTKEETLTDCLLKKYPEIENVGEPIKLSTGKEIKKSGIVHRLDRETSGVILVAKNQKSFEFLKTQFQNREIVKKYHAFVYGNFKENKGVIDSPIGRSKKDFRLRSAQKDARGKVREALTEYVVLKKSPEVSFVEALPKTGRTHQIRVHFKFIHHPVVCDSLYASTMKPLLGFKRLALHAFQIEFKNLSGEVIRAEANYPEDFENALKEFNSI